MKFEFRNMSTDKEEEEDKSSSHMMHWAIYMPQRQSNNNDDDDPGIEFDIEPRESKEDDAVDLD